MRKRLLSAVMTMTVIAAACSGGAADTTTSTSPTDGTAAAGTTAPTTRSTPAPGSTTTPTNSVGRELETVDCDKAISDVEIVCETYRLIQANYVDEIEDDTLANAATEGVLSADPADTGGDLVCPLPSDVFMATCVAAATETFMSGEELAQAMVRGMTLFALDPNSAYLDPSALDLLQEEQEGQIEGIGALVSPEDETIEGDNKLCSIVSDTCRIIIASTIEDTPAEAAGLQTGDIVVGVDGRPIDGWTVDEVTARVRGPAGTDVTLTMDRQGDVFDVVITRAAVVIPVLESARFGNDGYVRLSIFNATADEQFETAVVELLGEGIDDLVIDLRNNPGGLLDTAIEITSVFLETGGVVTTEGPHDNRTYQVTGAAMVPPDVDVYFVVNGGSASASEVVSAVLQERGRATVVGESTYGKNTVQQRFGLSNGGALKLTIARWLTPGGLDFGGTGVTPDVEMAFDPGIEPEQLVSMVVGLG